MLLGSILEGVILGLRQFGVAAVTELKSSVSSSDTMRQFCRCIAEFEEFLMPAPYAPMKGIGNGR
jgi:hypothetical protein